MLEMLSFTFMQRALLVGSLVAVCSALLGVPLVLKGYSMIGDGLSHVGFGALALATALNAAPLAVSVPVVVIAAFLLLRLGESQKVRGDAAIALVSTGALAVGIMLITFSTGMNVDVYSYMFGSILAMTGGDVIVSVILSVAVILFFIVFYPRIFAATFDSPFARAAGLNVRAYDTATALMTAITIVLGMRLMGSLLISALIIFPALTSMRFFKTFRSVVFSSVAVSVVCFVSGICASYIFSLPAGASVVCVNIIFYGIFALAGLIRGLRA